MASRQLNIKGRTYHFYNGLMNIKSFNNNNNYNNNNNNLKLDKKVVLGNDAYYIRYITKKPHWNLNSVNPLYLMINRIKGNFEEEDRDKYLIISSKDDNIMQKY